MSDPELAVAAVEASGLSARRFAEWLMGRDERTVRRWSAGQILIPPHARAWLEWWLALSDPERRRIIGLASRRQAVPTPARASPHPDSVILRSPA